MRKWLVTACACKRPRTSNTIATVPVSASTIRITARFGRRKALRATWQPPGPCVRRERFGSSHPIRILRREGVSERGSELAPVRAVAGDKQWPTYSPAASAETPRKQFPWVFKAAELQGVEALDIVIDHNPAARLVQGGRRGRGPRARTCARPGDGHVRNSGAPPPGARTLRRLDRRQRRPLVFSVQGRCAYGTTFEYSSDDR